MKAEVIEGCAYILNAPGEIWRFQIGGDGLPLIERVGKISSSRARDLCEPILKEFVRPWV